MRLIIAFCMLFIINNSIAQQVQEASIEIINGKKYYIHKVEQGHTLYAISKKYLIEIEEILSENPDIKDGLKIDQLIKIPLVKQNKNLEKSNSPAILNNQIIHTVEKGQTLYFISKLYNIDQSALVDANPGIENGIALGRELIIPIVAVKNVSPESISQAIDDGLIRHQVEKGETIYSLAKHYNVFIDSISIVNNGLPGGLRVGESIIIPKKKNEKTGFKKQTALISRIDTISGFIRSKFRSGFKNDSAKIVLDTYNVALFLPLFLDENDSLRRNKKDFESESISSNSLIGLSFYEGFKFAIDSLKNIGLSVRLYVYDTENDTSVVKVLTKKEELKEMDLMIGPLYSSGFTILSDYARKHQIHIVTPFSNNPTLIRNNLFASKPNASAATKLQYMMSYLSSKLTNENVLVVNSGSLIDKELFDNCSSSCKVLFDNIPVKEINYLNLKTEGLKNSLSNTKTNIIIVPSIDQAFVTSLISSIYYWSREYKIIIVGLDSWTDFDNLDMSYLDKLNFHYATSSYTDYEGEETKRFLACYRKKNFIDPDYYAMQGFDIGFYYLSVLFNNGVNIDEALLKNKFKGIQSSFDFSRMNSTSGFENRGVFILKYQDFKLLKLN